MRTSNTKPTDIQRAEAIMLAHKINYAFLADWELARLIEYLENRPELIIEKLKELLVEKFV